MRHPRKLTEKKLTEKKLTDDLGVGFIDQTNQPACLCIDAVTLGFSPTVGLPVGHPCPRDWGPILVGGHL